MFIRVQRQLAHMSLREVAALTSVSNAYLSQVERGLHQPSLRVLRSIAQALNIAPEELLRRANFLSASTHADDAGAAGPDTARAGGADTGRRATGPDAGPNTRRPSGRPGTHAAAARGAAERVPQLPRLRLSGRLRRPTVWPRLRGTGST